MASNRVGQEIELPCGRCKELRYHTVAALGPGGRIEQVVCNFCHTPHRYTDPAGRADRPDPAARPRPRRGAADVDDGSQPARPYAPGQSYEKGQVLAHPKYGRGKVAEVRGDRIDVRFSDGSMRVFVHAPRPPTA